MEEETSTVKMKQVGKRLKKSRQGESTNHSFTEME